jgi:hypothetical protein
MARIGANTSEQWYQARRHQEAVARKYARIAMYNALLDEWEKRDDADHDYLHDLRRRLHMAEAQLKNMKP